MTHLNPIKVERPPEHLATLLLLLQRARKAETVEEVGFLLVNETGLFLTFRQAFLWQEFPAKKGYLSAVANLPAPNPDAPLSIWLTGLCHHLQKLKIQQPVLIDRSALPESLTKEWEEHLAPYALWAPIPESGGLLLAGDSPWSQAECRLLSHWTEGAGQCLENLRLRKSSSYWLAALSILGRKPVAIAVLLLLVGLLFLPMRLSVLAPAEVVPSSPVVVRAPLAGVIDTINVVPNDAVEQGDVLFQLDDRELLSRLEVARQGLEMAQSEYRHAAQAAITSTEAQVRKALLGSRIEQHRTEYAYVNELLQRVEVRAERPGIALFPDAASLKGRPVRLGEKVMTLADPHMIMLEAWIPPADSVELVTGAPVSFFLNIRPDNPLSGELHRVALQATLSPDGFFGYRAEIHFSELAELPHIGLRGTAKIHGPRVNLAYLIFRRPLTAMRQMVGW